MEENNVFKFYGMDDFQYYCRSRLMHRYAEMIAEGIVNTPVNEDETTDFVNNFFVVWSCKTLQNYKCLCSTTFDGDGVYAEYTYNGDKQELYEDIYIKCSNTCIKEK